MKPWFGRALSTAIALGLGFTWYLGLRWFSEEHSHHVRWDQLRRCEDAVQRFELREPGSAASPHLVDGKCSLRVFRDLQGPLGRVVQLKDGEW